MKRMTCVAAVALAVALGGCSAKSEAPAPPPAAAKPIPPDSPLAKVRVGMTAQQVTDLLGQPTSQTSYESGKRWIPFYYGSDVRRTEWAYKGLGRVVFTGGNQWGAGAGEVQRVDYDPSETGVRAN